MNADRARPLHRIRKLVFDFRYPSEGAAFHVRKRLEEQTAAAFVPVIERAFDAAAPPGVTLHLDRLELDLGRLAAKALEAENADSDVLQRRIERQLEEALRQAQAPEAQRPEAAPLGLLLGFLRTGRLPWHAADVEPQALERDIRAFSPQAARSAAIEILAAAREPGARLRLVHQFSSDFPAWLVRQAVGAGAEHLLAAQSVHAQGLPPPRIADMLLALAGTVSPDQDISPGIAETLWTIALSREGGSTHSYANDERAGTDVGAHSVSQRDSAQARTPPAGASADTNRTGEEYFVQFAGVVLLHPFLPRFFAALDLLDERQGFRSPHAQARAVHLLHYLGTGAENPPEPVTVLLKVLCGLPLAAPLVRELPLTEGERDEAENLLAAAIGHWSKLGRTSHDGFREAFLQRDGKLSGGEPGWRLAVEQRGIDVLLSYLPWRLSVVRLPWMDAPLWVDWA